MLTIEEIKQKKIQEEKESRERRIPLMNSRHKDFDNGDDQFKRLTRQKEEIIEAFEILKALENPDTGLLDDKQVIKQVFRNPELFDKNQHYRNTVRNLVEKNMNYYIGQFIKDKGLNRVFNGVVAGSYFNNSISISFPHQVKITKTIPEHNPCSPKGYIFSNNTKGITLSYDSEYYKQFVEGERLQTEKDIQRTLDNYKVYMNIWEIIRLLRENAPMEEVAKLLGDEEHLIDNPNFEEEMTDNEMEYKIMNRLNVCFRSVATKEQVLQELEDGLSYFENGQFEKELGMIIVFLNNLLGTNIAVSK